MSGSDFIVQTSKFLLINATAETLHQGYGKVIKYISPDPYILYAKFLRFSSKGFDGRGKSSCSCRCGGRGGGGGRNELKTYSHPRPGWLKYIYKQGNEKYSTHGWLAISKEHYGTGPSSICIKYDFMKYLYSILIMNLA